MVSCNLKQSSRRVKGTLKEKKNRSSQEERWVWVVVDYVTLTMYNKTLENLPAAYKAFDVRYKTVSLQTAKDKSTRGLLMYHKQRK